MPNHTMFQFFYWRFPPENHLWQEVIREASHLSELGITAVWFPPACKGADGGDSVGYDAYDLYDLGEFDQKGSIPTRYGTMSDYLQAVNTLHEHHIQIYADVVLNHKAGADESEEVLAHKVNPDNRNEVISEDYNIRAYTKFTFPGRSGKYSTFKWDFHCFSGVDWDANKQGKAVFKLVNEYGEEWENLPGNEKGNFDYLMFADTEFRNPAVREELKNWALWYLQTTGVDGFRLDAVKHITPSFFPNWLQDLRTATQKELFAVGEHASPLEVMITYLKDAKGCMSLFDFPLQLHFHEASIKGADYDLRTIFDQTLTQSDAIHSVTFVDNHDSQASRGMGLEVMSWFLPHAYSLILLREKGYPCVFYPHLYGFHKDESGQNNDGSEDTCASLDKLLIARKQYAYGIQKDYFEQPGMIGWIREGNDDPASGMAAVLSNKEEGFLEMEVGKKHAHKVFYEITGSREDKVNMDENGKGRFPVNAGKIAVWVPQ